MQPERKKPNKAAAEEVRYLPIYGEVAFPSVDEMSQLSGIPVKVLQRRLDLACEAGAMRRFRIEAPELRRRRA